MLDSKRFKLYRDILSYVNDNSSTPVVNSVKVENNFLSSTDLETSIEIFIDGLEVDKGFCIPFHAFTKTSKVCKDKVSFSPETISIDKGKEFKYDSLDNDDFPVFPEFKGYSQHCLHQEDIESLEYVKTAICKDDIRRNLAGVLFETVDNKLTAVATDGHRLHFKNLRVDKPSHIAINDSTIVPRNTIEVLLKVVKKLKYKGDIDMTFSEGLVKFYLDQISITGRLIEDVDFPNYRKAIPTTDTHNGFITATGNDFKSTLKEHLDMKLNHNVYITLNGSISIQTKDLDLGEYNTTLEGNYEGPQHTIGLNVNYLLDAIKGHDKVSIGYTDDLRPITINDTAVLMPVRI